MKPQQNQNEENKMIVSCSVCKKKFRIAKRIRFQCKYCGALIDPDAQYYFIDDGFITLPSALKATQEELVESCQGLNKKFQLRLFHTPSHFLKKCAYWYDNFIAQGPYAMFLTLLALFLVSWGLCIILYVAIGHSVQFWLAFRQICDPGSLSEANDFTTVGKMVAVFTGMTGVVIFSLLIAFLTNIFDQKFQELKKGYSTVMEDGHILILGWSDKIVSILTELIIANSEKPKGGVIVILSSKPKEDIEDYLRTVIKKRMNTRIIVRSGEISNIASLEKVAISRCQSIILLIELAKSATKKDVALGDTQIIKTVLSICKNPARRPEPFNIVTEIGDPKNIDIARSIGEDEVTILYTHEIIAKILVQTSRQNGLAQVYNEILAFSGNELYLVNEANTHGKTMSEILCDFPVCVPLGLKQYNKPAQINPPPQTIICPGDQVILLAENENTLYYQKCTMDIGRFRLPADRKARTPKIERQLLLGWNAKSQNIVQEYGNYLSQGSEVDIVVPSPRPEIENVVQQLCDRIPNVTIRLIDIDYRLREELEKITPFSYDNIILLASELDEDATMEEIDSQTIYTLLLLRDMQKKMGKKEEGEGATKLITELLNPANQELLQIARVNDFIISNQLISMMLAQISEQKQIYEVYYDLFRSEGSEIYLKPASVYFERLPVEVNFYDIMGVVMQRNEIPFGYRIHRWTHRPDLNFGIKLNPDKQKKIFLDTDDQIIVVAENEF